MLFNNPNSHRAVKHWQHCWLKRVIKLISHILFYNTVVSLCLEIVRLNDNFQVQLLNGNSRGVGTLCNEIKRGILVKSDKQGSYHNSTRNIFLKLCFIAIRTYISIVVRLSVVEFPGNKVLCLRGSAICTVALLIRLCTSFKTSSNFNVRWPAIACLLGRFADLLMVEWL